MAVLLLALASPPADARGADAALADASRRVAAIDGDDARRLGSSLWGRDLDVPIALHDPVANATVLLRRGGSAEPVPLPPGVLPANTCIPLAGEQVALLLLPLPESSDDLAALAWHERWHCAQDALGLPAQEADNAHLDGEAGRTWLRLELRALARALAAGDDHARVRRHALAALAFRAQRSPQRMLATGPLLAEAAVERNEGLAEYSGRRIAAGRRGMEPSLQRDLAAGDERESYVRTAAYLTGPAYGALLDRYAPGWRAVLDADADLASLLARALGVDGREPARGDHAAADYGADGVRSEERARAMARERRAATHRASLVDGSVLRAPLRKPGVSFDPRSLFPLGEQGTVYAPLTVKDAWGRLEAKTAALLAGDWSMVSVDATAIIGCGAEWRGGDWQLELAGGWRLDREGDDWTIVAGESDPCATAGGNATRPD